MLCRARSRLKSRIVVPGLLGLMLAALGTLGGSDARAAVEPQGTANPQLAVGPLSTPPVPVIYAPTNGALYFPGDTIQLIGFGTDAEDGGLPFTSFAWKVVTIVCPAAGACTETVFFEATGAYATTPVPSPTVPVDGYFFSRAELTATDTDGDKTTVKHVFGPDADTNGCMDAYAQRTVNLPPFTIGAADHISSGTAVNGHFELTDITTALNLTGSWSRVDAGAGTSGQEISFGMLAVPFTVSQAGFYSLTIDTDLFGALSGEASGAGAGSSSLAVFGAVLSTTGVVGDIELLQLERAFDDASGTISPLPIERTFHPFGFLRTLPAGSYYLALIISVEASASTPVAGTAGFGEGYAISLTRVSVVCELRAPTTHLGNQATAYRDLAAMHDQLTPGLRAFGDRLGTLATTALSERRAGEPKVSERMALGPEAFRDLLGWAAR